MINTKSIQYSPCDIEKLEQACHQKHKKAMVSYSMRDFLAKKNANSIWGTDYTFEAEDETLVNKWTEFATKNRFLPLAKYIERELSLHGRVIVLINKNKQGDIKLNVANPYFYAAIGKVFVSEDLAVVWQRVILDTGTFYVKSIYDKEKCINEVYNHNNEIMVYDQVREIAGLGIEPIWNHNLGFVPVVELTNYPLFEFQNIMFSPEMFYKVADWYSAAFFEDTFYELWKNFNKEVVFCHSRLAIESANQALLDNVRNATKYEGQLPNDILGDYLIETETGGKATAISGVGDFTKYTAAMNDVMDFYFKFACSSRFSEGGGAQKTSAEANSSNSSQLETLEAKIKHREYEYTMLIAKVLAALGIATYEPDKEYEFVFRINGNIQRKENSYLDYVLKQVQAGTMSLVEAIATLRGISLQKAEQVFDTIKEFNEENDMQISGQAQEGEGEMGFASDGFDKGGAPEKVDN